jgi:uncharacterized membrane protein YoaK (UPF0700 family)
MNAFMCGAAVVFALHAAVDGKAFWASGFALLAAAEAVLWAGVLA